MGGASSSSWRHVALEWNTATGAGVTCATWFTVRDWTFSCLDVANDGFNAMVKVRARTIRLWVTGYALGVCR